MLAFWLVELVACVLISSPAVLGQGGERYLKEDFTRGPGIFNSPCENTTSFEVHLFYDFPSVLPPTGSTGYYLTPALTGNGSCIVTGNKLTVAANAEVIISYYTTVTVATESCLFFVMDGDGNILVPKVIPIVNSDGWLSESIFVPKSTSIAMKFLCSEMKGSLLLIDTVEVKKPPAPSTTTTEPPTTLATTTTTKKGAASALQPHWMLLLLYAPFFILRLIS